MTASPVAPLNAKTLLEDLKKLLARVEADLLARSSDADVPEIGVRLRGEYDRARASKRTAATYDEWRTDRITQAAVAWVLSCVFVRFLEDNDLVSPPRIAGPGERLAIARGSHEKFFTSRPRDTDREFLLSIFDELQNLPGTADIFGGHNALREIPAWLSGDAAKEILKFFQRIDASTGTLVHDFTTNANAPEKVPATISGQMVAGTFSPEQAWDTRFLGDLYQDLSAFARERYALLQTPHFVEQFLLERTLDPALAEFGLTPAFKMIDPACGSGHLVLGSFQKILEAWQKQEPATAVRELVSRTLGSVHGIDINPFAVAIARFRLLLVAMRACGISKLADAPAFPIHIECGDSLLHTPLVGGVQELFDKGTKSEADEECEHAYASEDLFKVKGLLRHGQYHAVMANPPYIVVRDPELNARYRKRFATCHRQYSLAVPFLEQIFKLAVPGGFTGQITANSFMKREFGSKLIEKFFPVTDLTHVIDTSGAYIPGHGTPTVILFGRRRAPVANTVRAVMGIRGEPTTPADPAKGLVWTAITGQVDRPGAQSEFVSASDTARATFHSHPWSIGGGGASELKNQLDGKSQTIVANVVEEIGFGIVTRDDDVFFMPPSAAHRKRISLDQARPCYTGEHVRDWSLMTDDAAIWPYDPVSLEATPFPEIIRAEWPYRLQLSMRPAYGESQLQRGLKWFEYSMFFKNRFRSKRLLVFAAVATHNHFSLGQGGKLFNRHSPVIKLPADATEDDHVALLGILNSSTACFWMKQVFFPKGGDHVGNEGARVRRTWWDERYEFAGTGLESFPLPASRPLDLARGLQAATDFHASITPAAVMARWAVGVAAGTPGQPSLKEALATAAGQWQATRRQQIALQEELDWQAYSLYALLDEPLTLPLSQSPPPVDLGERAFEIALARRVAAGGPATTWFERHGSKPLTEIPAHWPADYRKLIQKRLDAIEANPNVKLIEQPEYKRRWNTESWADRQATALREFLLERLERLFDHDGRMNDSGAATAEFPIGLVSIGDLATAARRDRLFMEAAEVLTGDVAFDAGVLIAKLVEEESCPVLPQLRYKPTGARKHAEWHLVWELQRKEDAIDARSALPPEHPQHLSPEQAAEKKRADIGDIPVPPKYTSADFAKPGYWRLRGKLDVPKERFVALPGIAGPDGTPVYAWAGLNHLELAKAIGDFYGLVQTEYGGSDDPRLVPLLANLSELLPWVQQWHPETLPDYGGPPADFYNQFIRDEAAARGLTWADIRAWTPPVATRGKRAAKKAAKRVKGKQPENEDPATDGDEEVEA